MKLLDSGQSQISAALNLETLTIRSVLKKKEKILSVETITLQRNGKTTSITFQMRQVTTETGSSQGWDNRFKHRNNLCNLKISGETEIIDAMAKFQATLKTIIKHGNCPPKLVFNVDEPVEMGTFLVSCLICATHDPRELQTHEI